jgi:hypothetical protein
MFYPQHNLRASYPQNDVLRTQVRTFARPVSAAARRPVAQPDLPPSRTDLARAALHRPLRALLRVQSAVEGAGRRILPGASQLVDYRRVRELGIRQHACGQRSVDRRRVCLGGGPHLCVATSVLTPPQNLIWFIPLDVINFGLCSAFGTST